MLPQCLAQTFSTVNIQVTWLKGKRNALKEEGVDWIQVCHGTVQSCEHGNEPSDSIKCWKVSSPTE
jgi:hypothetical protein